MITPRNHVAITHRPASSYAAMGQGHKSVNNLTEFSYSHRESQTHDLLIAGPMLHQFGHCLKAVLEKRVLNGHSVVVAVISYNDNKTHTYTHTHLTALCPGLPGWASTRKVKPIWILLKQETVSGSSISWDICKSAPHSRQITMPAPRHSVITGQMPFLLPN